MRIKSRYYEKGLFPKLQKDVEEALKPFPEFREELFDKLILSFSVISLKAGQFISDILPPIKFDVSKLEHKKAFEKREIIYEFKEKRNDGVIVFTVSYSERGKITKIDEILKALKKEGI